MQTSIDGKEIGLSGADRNLEGVLKEVMGKYLGEDRIMWSITLNGEQYNEKSPHDARKIRTEDIQTLEIATMDKIGICRSFLKNGRVLLDSLCNSAQKISELFRMGDEKEANKHYARFLESYQGLFQMIEESKNTLRLDFQNITIEGTSIDEKTAALGKLFDKMMQAQKEKDWILLADCVEFELQPLLKEWGRILPVLDEKAVIIQ